MKGKKVLAFILAVSVMMTNGSITYAAEDTIDTGSSEQTADISEQAIEIEQQEVPAYGESTEGQTEDGFSYTIADGQARITAYTGTDVNVNIPSSIEGYPVTTLAKYLFLRNTTIETVYIPETITHMEDSLTVFTDATSLKEINVSKDNEIYFSRDGVLFVHAEGKPEGLPVMVKYPEGKSCDTYVIPDDVMGIGSHVFRNCPALGKIIVPESVNFCADESFRLLEGVTIILKQEDTSQIALDNRAFTELTNCVIIVKNEEMKQWAIEQPSGEAPLYLSPTTKIKISSELTAEEKSSYLTPATSLVFADTGAATKSITLKPDSLAEQHANNFKNWNGVSDLDSAFEAGTYMDVEYAVSPADTTDSVTWESGDPGVAIVAVRNGKVRIIGAGHGQCVITGKDESGHTLILNVLVTIPIQDIQCSFHDNNFTNSGTASFDYDSVKNDYVFNNNGESRIYFSIWSTAPDNMTQYTPTCNELLDWTITGDTNKLIYKTEHRQNGAGEEWDEHYFKVDGPGVVTLNVSVKDDDGSIKKGIFTLKVVKSTSSNEVDNKNESTPQPEKKSQKITNVSSSYKKAYKSSVTLKPKAKTSCTYKTSNSRVATVNSKGKVTIKGTGRATITITAKATSAYKSATKKITIYAIPAKMKTPTVKAGKRKLSVSWKKDSKADGYQIQYSTSSKFKKAKNVSCSKKTAKTTLKKLKSGKKYYVRIRAYKKIGNKKYYGSYSRVNSIKVK